MLEDYVLQSILNSQAATRSMTLTGQGRILLAPDVTVIRLGVQLTEEDPAAAQSQNAALSQAVLDALYRMGVTDIKTFQYTMEKSYQYESGVPVDRGYTVSNIFEIRTNDTEAAGSIIDAAVTAGANVTDLISFEVSNPEYYYQQALNLAVQDAMEKAESISENLGIQIDLIPAGIIENSSPPGPVQPFRRELAATPVVPGNTAIEAEISAEFLY